jgi:hypothetical protein
MTLGDPNLNSCKTFSAIELNSSLLRDFLALKPDFRRFNCSISPESEKIDLFIVLN